jgi:hypothetical protein
MAASYCAFAGCALKSVIHHHKPHCAITASESPSADQRLLPTADVGSRLTQVPTWEALFLWAVTQHLPWMGTCPFTQWLPTREESMFMSVVVNKQYSTGGRDAVPWRSCMGTLGSGVSCLSFWKPPHLPLLISYDSAPRHRA